MRIRQLSLEIIKDSFRNLRLVRRTIKNWFSVSLFLYFFIGKEKYIKVKIRGDNDIIRIDRRAIYPFVYFFQLLPEDLKNEARRDFKNGIITLQFMNNILKLKYCQDGKLNGDIIGVFMEKEYKCLSLDSSSVVIDIGANIGDSAIYFALMGAKRILALEPYPYSYNIARYNISVNKLNEKIMLINAGYGTDTTVNVSDMVTEGSTPLYPENFENSNKIPKIELLSLKTLIEKYNLSGENLFLKMDCEGCEYNLLNEDDLTLKKFNQIVLEYHHGYEKLVRKLNTLNFKVDYTKPVKFFNKNYQLNYAQGIICARKKQE